VSGFATYEESQQGGRPAHLYTFTIGSDVYRFNSTESDLTAGGFVFDNWQIAHSEPASSTEARTKTLDVLMLARHELVGEIHSKNPTSRVLVLIQKVHRSDLNDPKFVFSGMVRNLVLLNRGLAAKFVCLPYEGRFLRRIPKASYSAQCENQLFDLNCQASRTGANLFTGTIASVSGDIVVVTGLDALKGVGWAQPGEVVVVSTGERRTVRLHAATDSLTLMFPFDVNPTGESVEVTTGCRRTLADCKRIQGHVLNYGNWPHISPKNPFETGVR
jgi:hypothetical protein